MAGTKNKKPTDRRLLDVIGKDKAGSRGSIPTVRGTRIKAGKAVEGLFAENLTNPKVATDGVGGFDDAADLARQKARADWRAARDASHDDT